MKVFATQCPLMKQGNELVPKFRLGPEDWMGVELRRRYGQLIWVLEPNVAPWTPGVMDLLREGLREYNGDTDHLLLLGNPVLMSMMTLYAGEHNNRVRFLQWSNGSYMPLQVEL